MGDEMVNEEDGSAQGSRQGEKDQANKVRAILPGCSGDSMWGSPHLNLFYILLEGSCLLS